VLCDPLTARFPDQPPVAVQAVALVELHDSVEAAPAVTVVGAAASVTVGSGLSTLTVADADDVAGVPELPPPQAASATVAMATKNLSLRMSPLDFV